MTREGRVARETSRRRWFSGQNERVGREKIINRGKEGHGKKKTLNSIVNKLDDELVHPT